MDVGRVRRRKPQEAGGKLEKEKHCQHRAECGISPQIRKRMRHYCSLEAVQIRLSGYQKFNGGGIMPLFIFDLQVY